MSKENLTILINFAKESYCLPIIISLFDLADIDYNQEIYDIFFNNKTLEQQKENLIKFVIISPLNSINNFTKIFPDLRLFIPKILNLISLLVRFPNKEASSEIGKYNLDNYFRDSIEYAKKNNQFVEKSLPKLSMITRENLLYLIFMDRYQRLKGVLGRGNYRTTQKKWPQTISTNIILYNKENNTLEKCHKYYPSLKHFHNLLYDRTTQQYNICPNHSMALGYKNQVTYSYPLNKFSQTRREKNIEITRLHRWGYPSLLVNNSIWIHNLTEVDPVFEKHLEELHKEILDFPLNSENKKLFFEKVARGYWLIATLCETYRGTPHNAMIWLNLIYRHHDLPPPVPKLEHFFLDNTMLVWPVEEAIDKWETLFENTDFA